MFFFLGSGIVRCDIPGLVSRVEKPLDFLGLYKTEHEASLRAHIPAREISGKTPKSRFTYFYRGLACGTAFKAQVVRGSPQPIKHFRLYSLFKGKVEQLSLSNLKFQERLSSLTCFLQPNVTFIDQKSWTVCWPDSTTKSGRKKGKKIVKTFGKSFNHLKY